MATSIKETPILRGKEAIKFIEENREVKKISEEEKREILKNYNFLKSIAEFEF